MYMGNNACKEPVKGSEQHENFPFFFFADNTICDYRQIWLPNCSMRFAVSSIVEVPMNKIEL